MDLVGALKDEGAASVKDFVSGSQLAALREDWEWVLPARANYQYGFGLCARFSLSDLPSRLRTTADLFGNDSELRGVSDSILGKNHGYMEVLAFTHEFRVDSEEIYGRLHFDRKRQLKFIIYLDPTSSEEGAFRYIPRSMALGRKIRRNRWRSALGLADTASEGDVEKIVTHISEGKLPYQGFECEVTHEELSSQGCQAEETVLSGGAGTLVVFDTDVIHSGGLVSTGHERRAIKGHCFPEPQKPGAAWQESPRCITASDES